MGIATTPTRGPLMNDLSKALYQFALATVTVIGSAQGKDYDAYTPALEGLECCSDSLAEALQAPEDQG